MRPRPPEKRRWRKAGPRPPRLPAPLAAARVARAVGGAWLRPARGRFKGASGDLRVRNPAPGGSGSCDGASTASVITAAALLCSLSRGDRRTGGRGLPARAWDRVVSVSGCRRCA